MKTEEVLHLFTPISDGLPDTCTVFLVLVKNEKGKLFIHSRYFFPELGIFDSPPNGFEITHYLDLSKLTTKAIPDPYDPYIGTLNEKRIQAYHKIANMYTCSPSSVRDIFCAGIDWYKSELEKL